MKEKFIQRGFKPDVSYTTRKPREGETHGQDYYFISEDAFINKAKLSGFYESVKYEGVQYGTGINEWEDCDIFIMETNGISKLKPEDRKESFVVFINPEEDIRIERMKERGWNQDQIDSRIATDQIRFNKFKDYDLLITNPNF